MYILMMIFQQSKEKKWEELGNTTITYSILFYVMVRYYTIIDLFFLSLRNKKTKEQEKANDSSKQLRGPATKTFFYKTYSHK